jgi:hypothetical protein
MYAGRGKTATLVVDSFTGLGVTPIGNPSDALAMQLGPPSHREIDKNTAKFARKM